VLRFGYHHKYSILDHYVAAVILLEQVSLSSLYSIHVPVALGYITLSVTSRLYRLLWVLDIDIMFKKCIQKCCRDVELLDDPLHMEKYSKYFQVSCLVTGAYILFASKCFPNICLNPY
jgi:hypothetical protein